MLTFALALAACSSMKVQTEYDRTADFKGYRTYAWILQQPGPEQAPEARDPRIRESVFRGVDQALASKGMTRVAPDQSPELLVAVHGWAVNRIDVQSYGYHYGATPYGFYPTMATPAVEVRQYRDGTLIIDLVISDHHMPELSGIDLLKLVRVRHPHVVRIIITADQDPDTAVRSINESEVYRFIRKPWNDSDLRTIMHFAFEVVRLEREKRRLLSMVRDERAARLLNGSPEDPVGIESELLLLAEDELHGS